MFFFTYNFQLSYLKISFLQIIQIQKRKLNSLKKIEHDLKTGIRLVQFYNIYNLRFSVYINYIHVVMTYFKAWIVNGWTFPVRVLYVELYPPKSLNARNYIKYLKNMNGIKYVGV